MPLDRNPYFWKPTCPEYLQRATYVRHGSVKRCASGAGEGAMAVAFVLRYLAGV
jgi:thioredoxin reductase (NADPH)